MKSIETRQITLRGHLFDFSRPRVMGILNVTPDSFYAKSRVNSDEIAAKAGSMLADGADIIDIGACSTRPGAVVPSPAQEYDRLAPALEALRSNYPQAIISIDTFRAEIADKCVRNFNVDIINDISGGSLDCNMFDTIAELNVAYVLMHTRGTPQTMQQLTQYNNVTADIIQDLAFKLDSLHQKGVANVIVDPGFGFAKTIEQNYQLLADLKFFHELRAPILAGISRKSMICKPLNISPEDALCPTVAIHTIALMNGADIIRVHDVKSASQSVEIFMLTKSNNISQSFDIQTIQHNPCS